MKYLAADRTCFARFVTRDEEGMSVVETALLLALIAIIVVGGITVLGSSINGMFSLIGSSL
jgi:pilus assembly protein Flp/PilA